MKKLKKYIDKIVETVTSVLFLVMVAITTWQVITRYVLHDPSANTEEFLKYSLVWFSLLAGAYVVGKKKHIAITILHEQLKKNKKLVIDIIIQLSFLIFALIMLYGGSKAVSITMVQTSPSLGLPMGYVYLSLPVSGILVFFYSTVNLFDIFNENKTSLDNKTKN